MIVQNVCDTAYEYARRYLYGMNSSHSLNEFRKAVWLDNIYRRGYEDLLDDINVFKKFKVKYTEPDYSEHITNTSIECSLSITEVSACSITITEIT